MSLDVEITPEDIKAAEDAANSFAVLPKGSYNGTIKQAKVQAYEKGTYKDRKYLNVLLRIGDNEPVGAKRTFFLKVPLFGRWAPSAKHPAGYPTNYLEFFTAVGVEKERIALGKGLPGPDELAGKPVSFYLQVRDPDDYNTEERNEVGRISAPKGGTPSAVQEIAGDVWGTPGAPTSAAEDPWAPAAADVDHALAAAAASGKTY